MMNRNYTAQEALAMGLVNKVVPQDKLMEEVDIWCEDIVNKSPTALTFIKMAFNASSDWIYGMQRLAGEALWQYYASDEALEGRNSFLQKRKADFKQFLKKDR
jgi:naphthoate synthase